MSSEGRWKNRRRQENPVTKNFNLETLTKVHSVAAAYKVRRLLISRRCDSHQQRLQETASITRPAERAEQDRETPQKNTKKAQSHDENSLTHWPSSHHVLG